MSLPLTRRIARAALLVAAGAVPVVGAAGSASAVDLPAADGLSGLTQLDSAGDTGGAAVDKAVPTVGKAVDQTGKTATPVAKEAAGDAAGDAGQLVGDASGGLPTGSLPTSGLPLG